MRPAVAAVVLMSVACFASASLLRGQESRDGGLAAIHCGEGVSRYAGPALSATIPRAAAIQSGRVVIDANNPAVRDTLLPLTDMRVIVDGMGCALRMMGIVSGYSLDQLCEDWVSAALRLSRLGCSRTGRAQLQAVRPRVQFILYYDRDVITRRPQSVRVLAAIRDVRQASDPAYGALFTMLVGVESTDLRPAWAITRVAEESP